MLTKPLLFLTLIFAVKAVNIKDVLANHPELQECIPTFKMFDASGRVPSGVYSGNLVDLGNFDQCLNIEETNNKSELIRGKYCIVKFGLPAREESAKYLLKLFGKTLPIFPEPDDESPQVRKRMIIQGSDHSDNFLLGLCIAHQCPIDDLSAVLSSTLKKIDPKMRVTPIMGGMCQTKDDLINDYNTESIILITFLMLTLFLMIISTLYDIYIQHYKKKPAHIIYIALSVKTNGEKLLSVNNNSDQLPCLNGIRFLSMIWIVYCHRFFSTTIQPSANYTDLKDWIKNPANMYILAPPVAVDTFFVLSGMLVAYGYCLARDKGIKFNIILFYLHRYLRLTPVLAVLIWIHATIIGFFGSGPFWPFASGILKDFCVENWWSPLLYVQNYYNTEEMCIGPSWYLAVDMQLYILSPIILIPLLKWPKRTLFAATVLVFASMASSFAVTYFKDLPIWSMPSDGQKYMDDYYMTTHTRYGPWLMGLMLGYYLFKLKKKSANRMHPTLVLLGWIISLGLLLSTLFAGHDLAMNRNKLGDSFFNGFHRHGWALGLCWVIYACTQGYGGPVNTFLSWSLFQILGRFTYTVYLVHFSLQFVIMGANRSSTYFSNFNLMYSFWGDFMFALAISVCLTLAYEIPMVTIEKVLFKTGHKSKKPDLPVHINSSIEGGQTNIGFEGDEKK